MVAASRAGAIVEGATAEFPAETRLEAAGFPSRHHHVVEHGASFKVATEDGTTYIARVVGADLRTDLALLKVDGRNDFPYVKLADHEPHIGDWVIAVGNPFGLGGTVTAGIVSARGCHIAPDSFDDFIQIDAPINRGNSGGPSFDVAGNVVGVNTAIYSPSGGSALASPRPPPSRGRGAKALSSPRSIPTGGRPRKGSPQATSSSISGELRSAQQPASTAPSARRKGAASVTS
jgi:serine protease Do